MAAGDTARLYHRLSSFAYVPEDEWPTPILPPPIADPLVVQNYVPYDQARLPPHWKEYPPGLPTVELPREWHVVDVPATTVLAGRHLPAPATPDQRRSAGSTRARRHGGRHDD